MSERPRPTPSQTVGPFFGFALPFTGDVDAVRPDGTGTLRVEGQVLDGAGEPVPDSLVEVWHASQFARCRTDVEGAFHFNLTKPAALRLFDGRVRAPHMNVTVFARGLLRHLLGAALEMPASTLAFEYGAHGKPALAPAFSRKRPLCFNLSHSAHAEKGSRLNGA